MSFTDNEKDQIRYFLSYPSWVALSGSIQLGYPAASQPLFLVEDAFKRLTSGGENQVRRALCQCEAIEAQLADARTRFKAVKLGEITMNPHESEMLRKEMLWWVTRLADGLGVISNPFSQMMFNAIGSIGGVQARVVG